MVLCRTSAPGLNLFRKETIRRFLVRRSFSLNVRDVNQDDQIESDYPPVLDTSYKATKNRETERWHKLIQNLPTAQEKQLELNMSRYYGHWSCQLSSHDVHYNHAEFVQFATRSNIVEAWPDAYINLDTQVNKFLPSLKKKIEDILILELCHR